MEQTMVCGCGQGGGHYLVVREGRSGKVTLELRDLIRKGTCCGEVCDEGVLGRGSSQNQVLRPEKSHYIQGQKEDQCRETEEGGTYLVRDEVEWWAGQPKGVLLAVGRRWGPWSVFIGGGSML